MNQEFFTFSKLQRNSAEKIIQTNKDIFMIWGQNGVIATLMTGLYILVWALRLGTYKNIVIKGLVFLQRQLLVMFFVKMQFTALVELGNHDITRKQDGVFIYSYVLSWIVLSITAVELLRAYVYVKRGQVDYEKMYKENTEVA